MKLKTSTQNMKAHTGAVAVQPHSLLGTPALMILWRNSLSTAKQWAILLCAIIGLALAGCEDVIDPNLEEADALVVVDAWLNDKPGNQTIVLTTSQPYFDNTLPPGIGGASVVVRNTTSGRNFTFIESAQSGEYRWAPPTPGDVIGVPGDQFELEIVTGSDTYRSTSRMGRVPAIDSVTFTFEEEDAFFPDSYVAEFWARDPVGRGDTYWIRAWKNGQPLNKPEDISIAFDAGFSNGGNFDGIIFIPPLRTSINPFDTDENDEFLSPYNIGDSVYVELTSITEAAFNYLNEVRVQTDRPGGFAELFAAPIANVSTNITSPSGKRALGFFNVASVSAAGKRLRE